jgi:chromosome segregation ATPase
MKNFQQNLLILLALLLCGLCAWQWREQTIQRNEIGTLNGLVDQRNTDIQNDTNAIAVLNHQIEQMDSRMSELKSTASTNEQLMASQKREISKLQFNNLGLTNEVNQYQEAVNALESKLKEAYANLARQNDAITNLVAERESLVKKYNDSVKDRNEVVTKYNDLVSQVQKLEAKQQ